MTRAAADVLPFLPRAPEPLSDSDLVRRLLDLAREADSASRPHVASLVVGAAYTMCDDLPPNVRGGGRRRSA